MGGFWGGFLFVLWHLKGLARVFRVVPFFLACPYLSGSHFSHGLAICLYIGFAFVWCPGTKTHPGAAAAIHLAVCFGICICISLGLRHLSPILFAFTFLAWCPGTTTLPGAAAAIRLAVCFCIFIYILIYVGFPWYIVFWVFTLPLGLRHLRPVVQYSYIATRLPPLYFGICIPGCGHCLNRTSRLLVTFPNSRPGLRMHIFRSLFALILVYNYSAITTQTGETCPSSGEVPLVANQTGAGFTAPYPGTIDLDLVHVGTPSQSRSSFFGQNQDEVQQDDFASRTTALEMHRLLAACESQTIVLSKLWGVVGRRERPHLQEEAVHRSRLELDCMGGTISQEAHEQFEQEEKQLNSHQGQRKGQRQRQREGCDQRDAAFTICQDDNAGDSSYHSLSCSHNASYAARSAIRKQRIAVCNQEGFPGQSDDATGDQRCYGTHRESRLQTVDARPPSCHYQHGQSPENSKRVNGCEGKAQTTVASTSCRVIERLATTVGKLRCKAGRVCDMHPESQEGHGGSPCPYPDAQCKGSRENSTSAPGPDSSGYCPRHEPHQGSRGKESTKTTPLPLGKLCDQNGSQAPRIIGANRRLVRRREGQQKGEKSKGSFPSKVGRWSLAIWYACAQSSCLEYSWHLKCGSALTCLKKAERVPSEGRSVRFDDAVNAYAAVDFQGCAAHSHQPQFDNLFNSMHPICELHTVQLEQDYVSPFDAIRNAQQLHASCIDDEYLISKPQHRHCLKPHVIDLWCADGMSGVVEPCLKTRLLGQRQSDTALSSDDHSPEEPVAGDADTADDALLTIEDFEQLNYLLEPLRDARDGEVTLVTYGLYAAGVGTRSTRSPPDEVGIRTAIFELWADYFVGEASASLHLVRPQEFLFKAEIHFIIEFGNPAMPLPRGDVPTLRRITWHEEPVATHSEPIAYYVSQRLGPQEVIIRCGLLEWCNVHTRTTCNLHVEKRICPPLVPVQLSPGSLVEIFIHFNPVEEEDETSLFQSSAGSSCTTQHGNIRYRTWPEPNEDFQGLLQEAYDNEQDIVVPLVGPIVFDDPNEWTRLAVDFEQPGQPHVQVVVHGLLHEEVGVRRLLLRSLSARFIEESMQGLWPEIDFLNKVIYLVNPQPLQGHLDEVTIILEFYDPWLDRDTSIKPILLECLQPGLDVIQRVAKYCPERVTKDSFPIEPSGCPAESSGTSVQIWIQDKPLLLHQAGVVKAGNLITLRYITQVEPIEEWIQHLFPGAHDFKLSTSYATMFENIGSTSWTFLEQVRPGEPSRQYTCPTPWLRFHDPYFVVQAFLEMLTHRQTGYDNYRIYSVSGPPGNQMTFLYGEPRRNHCLLQVSFSAKWDETWSETFCYQVRERQNTREFLRAINLEGTEINIFREGRPFHEDVAQFHNGDLVEIEFEQFSDGNTTISGEDLQGQDEVSSLQQRHQASFVNRDIKTDGQVCRPNPNQALDLERSYSQTDGLTPSLKPPHLVCRPNADIILEFDDIVLSPDGGRIIPPPNWRQNALLRYASGNEAVFRDRHGSLTVDCRTWLVPHGGRGHRQPRDMRIQAQLLIHLVERVRRLWRDFVDPNDALRVLHVRPTPLARGNQNRSPRLHLLVEVNRPLVSPLRPILLSFQQISAQGLGDEVVWLPWLTGDVITLGSIHQAGAIMCEPHNLLVPFADRAQGWMGTQQRRQVAPGAYIPIWWDLRWNADPVPAPRLQPVDDEDDASLMQSGGGREVSRSPRRVDDTPPLSTQSSAAHLLVHAFRLSREHRVIPLDRSGSQSLSAQVRRHWAAPARQGYVDLHLVSSPPMDLDSTADETYIVEFAADRQRQADPADKLILVDIKIQEDNPTVSGSHIRRVLWTRGFMAREDMLHLLASAGLCKLTTIRCTLQVNHNLWPHGDGVRRQMLHGDFVQLNVLGPEAVPSSHIQVALCEQEAADSQRFLYHASPSPSPEPTTPSGFNSDQEGPGLESIEEEERSPSHSLSMIQHRVKLMRQINATTCSGGAESRATPGSPHVSDLWCGDLGEYVSSSLPENYSNYTKDLNAKGQAGKEETAHFRRPLGDITNVLGTPGQLAMECGTNLQAVETGSKANDGYCEAVFNPVPRRIPIAIAPDLHPIACDNVTVPVSVSTQDISEILSQWSSLQPGSFTEEASALELSEEIQVLIQKSASGETLHHFHLFTDGSYNSDNGGAAWSFVVVTMDTEQYSPESQCRLVGYHTGKVTANHEEDHWHGAPHLNAYIAELEALFHAHWWALCNDVPCVHIHYDAMSAGQASAGVGRRLGFLWWQRPCYLHTFYRPGIRWSCATTNHISPYPCSQRWPVEWIGGCNS